MDDLKIRNEQGKRRIQEFFLKCFIITLFLIPLLYFFYPKYEFIDSTHRCNKVTGKVEVKTFLEWLEVKGS